MHATHTRHTSPDLTVVQRERSALSHAARAPSTPLPRALARIVLLPLSAHATGKRVVVSGRSRARVGGVCARRAAILVLSVQTVLRRLSWICCVVWCARVLVVCYTACVCVVLVHVFRSACDAILCVLHMCMSVCVCAIDRVWVRVHCVASVCVASNLTTPDCENNRIKGINFDLRVSTRLRTRKIGLPSIDQHQQQQQHGYKTFNKLVGFCECHRTHHF